MKKQLFTFLFSILLVAGLAPVTLRASTESSPSYCAGSSSCPMDNKSGSCPYKILTKEECRRVCKAKEAAIAKDPALAKRENRCKLWHAIVKADPSMKPICEKLRKQCRAMKKECHHSWFNKSSCQNSCSQK